MPPEDTGHHPKDARRDPRTGEAATDPRTSPADDPTHGVDPGTARSAGADLDPLAAERPSTRRMDAAAHGAMQNGREKRGGRAVSTFVLALAVLVVIGILVWLLYP